MQLQTLHITQFKNHEQVDFSFNKQVICFTGNNGVGKTNLLDAIYYLCLTKSYFNTTDAQNITTGFDFFKIIGDFEKGNQTENICCIQPLRGRKEISKNRLVYDKTSEHVGQFPVVMITPYDVELIHEGSEVRRKFIDAMICQVDKTYLHHLMQYQKILVQRNALLKQIAENNFNNRSGASVNLFSVLDGLDEQFIEAGNFILATRKRILPTIFSLFQKYYEEIIEHHELVAISYECDLLEKDFATVLKANRTADVAAQRSLIGPHRDDLLFTIFNQLLKKFGSQGQQKTFLLALKFAQWQFTFEQKKVKPILLLDDLYDRMDEQRINKLTAMLKNFGQVFITDTHPERIENACVNAGLAFSIFKI